MSFSQIMGMLKGAQRDLSPEAGLPGKGKPVIKSTDSNSAAGDKRAILNESVVSRGEPQPRQGLSEEERQRIQRLKAARLKEREQQQSQDKTRTSRPMSSSKATSSRSALLPAKTTSASTPARTPSTSARRPDVKDKSVVSTSEKPKKLKFQDLLKQADQLDSEKLKLTVKLKKENKERQRSSSRSRRSGSAEVPPAAASSSINTTNANRETFKQPLSKSPSARKSSEIYKPAGVGSKLKAPASPGKGNSKLDGGKPTESRLKYGASGELSKPSQSLRRKQEQKRKERKSYYDSEEEEDMDDFIVDDEEEEGPGQRRREVDYDRDEIWRMFNRTGKRRYMEEDEEDLSDMEASGFQVFSEEKRSAMHARREDEMEELALKKHYEEKKRRKAQHC